MILLRFENYVSKLSKIIILPLLSVTWSSASSVRLRFKELLPFRLVEDLDSKPSCPWIPLPILSLVAFERFVISSMKKLCWNVHLRLMWWIFGSVSGQTRIQIYWCRSKEIAFVCHYSYVTMCSDVVQESFLAILVQTGNTWIQNWL